MGERGSAFGLFDASTVTLIGARGNNVASHSGVEHRDLGSVELIEEAIRRGEGRFARSGALVVETGAHTGRSPEDKFVVRHGEIADEIWWGSVNRPMSPESFAQLHGDVVAHLRSGDRFQIDLSVGSDPHYALPVRLVTENAWSALFAQNLFLPPLRGEHDFSGWTILHAPRFAADPQRHETISETVATNHESSSPRPSDHDQKTP